MSKKIKQQRETSFAEKVDCMFVSASLGIKRANEIAGKVLEAVK